MKIHKKQGGMLLIEVLVAVLLFVVGILGMVKAMGVSQVAQADAQNRSEAGNFASVIVQRMRVAADNSSAANYIASLEAFRHLETTVSACSFSGTPSSNAFVTNWVADVRTGAGHLPGATAAMQQVLVDTTPGTGYNKVTVTLCWQGPNDLQPRRHTYSAYVNQNFTTP
jgi:type IV pilus modification protein PilV